MREKGFTLLELMVVVLIIGLLAALVVPKVIGRHEDAMIVKARHDVRALSNALSMYKLDNFSYPSTQQGLEALVKQPAGDPAANNWRKGGYIESLPSDPWGRPYQYLNPGEKSEFDVWTLGADGAPGGEGTAADIGNWNLDAKTK